MRETSRLVASLEGARVVGALPPLVDAIASDSRAVRPGTLFVAMRGQRSDGHAFVADAVRRGAVAAVVEHAVETNVPTIIVRDTRAAASRLADAFYDHPSRALTVVGVTGTNGKTTTTHLVRDVLDAAGLPCALVGTLGGSFGSQSWPLTNTTPLAIDLHALLAAQQQNGYDRLRTALMQAPPDYTKEQILVIARKVGLDGARLSHDMESAAIDARLDANVQLAKALALDGTPALVIGDTLVPGAIELAELEKAVATARTER